MLDWNDLRFVLECARHGGTSGAARSLGVNHATVARRIAAAEEALGARLFDRLPSGYVPTEAGLDAVKTAEMMEALQDDLCRQIGARDTELRGTLRVTASQLLFQFCLAEIVRDFSALYPEIKIELIATNTSLNLARREADVAIRFSKDPPEALVGRRLFEQRGAVFASKKFLENDPGADAPLDWIRFAHWPGPPAEVKAVRPLRPKLTVDDKSAAIGAVRAGIGATRLACFLGDSDPDLARVPNMPLFAQLPLWVLTHADLRDVPRIRVFLDFVTQRLLDLKPLFQGEAKEGAPKHPVLD
ncbi:LysR family transcriptional regulator [Cognatishimia maritima]|nr:LysR family transcriptional regulator [Cognatishimia maritima]